MSAEQRWHFVDGGGEQVGPMSVDELQGHVSNGMVAEHTLVWSEGMTDWLPASSIDGLFVAPVATLQQSTQAEPQVHQPQINLGSPLAARVNPYSTPQSNLGMGAGIQAKPGFWNVLFSFAGRIPRRTYWAYYFISMGITLAVLVPTLSILGENSPLTWIVLGVLYVALMWSSLALQCKRWHDRGKSGWWFLIGMIPVVGGIWAFVEVGCLRGTFGLNSYGEDPT